MEPEEEGEPEPYGSPAAEDRIWLHPSEMGSLLPPPGTGRHGTARHGRPRLRRASLRALAVPVLSGMVGAALAMGVMVVAGVVGEPRERVVERVADGPVYDLGAPEGAARLAAAVAPFIVGVRATTPDGERVGSGVVFRSDGHVVTNHHLVEGATSIEVTSSDGRSWAADHAGSDPETDLAVIGVRDTTLEPAVLGSARSLRVGDVAVVVGAPGGSQGSPSVTAGVIAGLGEVVEVGGRPFYDVIATDAMIGSRASGGALVDRSGTVVGIATKTVAGTGEDRLGLVIPIDMARRVADQLIAAGRVEYPWIGVSGTDLDPWTAKEYGVSKGTLVRRVTPGSPAEKSGIRVQDVVTAVERSPISSMNELMMLVRRHEPGDEVEVTVVRSGEPRMFTVELGTGPQQP